MMQDMVADAPNQNLLQCAETATAHDDHVIIIIESKIFNHICRRADLKKDITLQHLIQTGLGLIQHDAASGFKLIRDIAASTDLFQIRKTVGQVDDIQ